MVQLPSRMAPVLNWLAQGTAQPWLERYHGSARSARVLSGAGSVGMCPLVYAVIGRMMLKCHPASIPRPAPSDAGHPGGATPSDLPLQPRPVQGLMVARS